MSSECGPFELAVSTYLDGELPPDEMRALFFHLADCENCRAFLAAIRNVERRVLKEERIVASESLDERMVPTSPASKTKMDDGRERHLPGRLVKSEHLRSGSHPLNRRRMFRPSLAKSSLLAAILGFILGVLQPWSSIVAPATEPRVVYVSMLPDMIVLGHVTELNSGGKSK